MGEFPYLVAECGKEPAAIMEEIQHKKGKLFYSMGEVAEMFDVNASLIRFWEQKFDMLKPRKNKKGNRMFTPQDVDTLRLIYHLVKEKGMTLEGARKRIRDNREGASRDMEIVERLQSVRAMLQEIREELGGYSGDGSEVYEQADGSDEPVAAHEPGGTDSPVGFPGTDTLNPPEAVSAAEQVQQDTSGSVEDTPSRGWFIETTFDFGEEFRQVIEVEPEGATPEPESDAAACTDADQPGADISQGRHEAAASSVQQDRTQDREEGQEPPRMRIIEQTLF